MWTLFWDMHSGGGTKEPPYEKIYIQADCEEAISVFYARFGHNPQRVTCTCCGEDYSISSEKTLGQLSGYHRGCAFNKKTNKYIEKQAREFSLNQYCTLAEYKKREDVLIIPASKIKKEERKTEVPEEGYVWR